VKFGLPFDEINILFDFVAQRVTSLRGGQKPASRLCPSRYNQSRARLSNNTTFLYQPIGRYPSHKKLGRRVYFGDALLDRRSRFLGVTSVRGRIGDWDGLIGAHRQIT
jgi:hypothetical protein